MKLLVFADSHGWFETLDAIKRLALAEDVDLLLCVGDVTTFGKNQRTILQKINEIGKPVLMIHGNHEQEELLAHDCDDFDNITFLHKGAFRKGKYIFFGFGGGGFSEHEPAFERLSKHFKKEIRNDDIVVLMTHAPPLNTKLDDLNGKRVGVKDFRKFIEDAGVSLAVSGHIHEKFGVEDKIGNCIVVNPGPNGRVYEL